jgi:hypothetical protein
MGVVLRPHPDPHLGQGRRSHRLGCGVDIAGDRRSRPEVHVLRSVSRRRVSPAAHGREPEHLNAKPHLGRWHDQCSSQRARNARAGHRPRRLRRRDAGPVPDGRRRPERLSTTAAATTTGWRFGSGQDAAGVPGQGQGRSVALRGRSSGRPRRSPSQCCACRSRRSAADAPRRCDGVQRASQAGAR